MGKSSAIELFRRLEQLNQIGAALFGGAFGEGDSHGFVHCTWPEGWADLAL